MVHKTTVVLAQGDRCSSAQRELEEQLVALLIMESGVEMTVIPHPETLTPESTGKLCLEGITTDMILLSWLAPSAAHAVLERCGIQSRLGRTNFEDKKQLPHDGREADGIAATPPDHSQRTIFFIDLHKSDHVEPYLEEIRRIGSEVSVQTVPLERVSDMSPSIPRVKPKIQTDDNTQTLEQTSQERESKIASSEGSQPDDHEEPNDAMDDLIDELEAMDF